MSDRVLDVLLQSNIFIRKYLDPHPHVLKIVWAIAKKLRMVSLRTFDREFDFTPLGQLRIANLGSFCHKMGL